MKALSAEHGGWLENSEREERIMKSHLVKEAQLIGPSVRWIAENIWAESILEADRGVRHLLRLAQRYGLGRVEAACARAIYYRHDRSEDTIKWILEKAYDRFPLSRYCDIRGQFVFDFAPLSTDEPDNVDSGIIGDSSTE